MSTNPKDLNPKDASESMIAENKKTVDRSLRALTREMEHEHTLLRETPLATLRRALKIYRGIKPLLVVLAHLPIIPFTWRTAFTMFTQSLEALSAAAPEVTAAFKAGKDL
jgi:hypothetical protein